MKLHISVVVVAVSLIGFCDNVNARNAEMDSISELCKAQEKATDADMEMWKSDTEPKTRVVKCLEACLGEKMGMITNNKINVDAVMRAFIADSKDEKAQANMKETLNECKDETDDDRCEASAKILQCIHNGNRKRHMKEV